MTKQDMIRSLKKDLQDLKMFFLVVLTLATLFGALVGTYKGCLIISDAVQKAFEPTAEEKAEATAEAAEKAEWNRLFDACERRCPVGMTVAGRAHHCSDEADRIMNQK